MGLRGELNGFLVVSLEQAVAAPYCGLLLADAGARVIKVERPEGDFARGYDTGADGESAMFAWLNRGKESLALNLKEDDDMAVMRGLLARADVFLSNLAPGAVTRMGLDGPQLRQTNPKLITCSLSGYGDTGDAAQKKAYDTLVQAESGICAVTGTKDDPCRVGVPLTDLSTGLTAFSAILRALIQRSRTAIGVDLHITMFDIMADWMNMSLLTHRYGGGVPERAGLKHGFIAPYGAFDCGDGTQIMLSIQNNREWAVFCRDVLHRPDLIEAEGFDTVPARFANRAAVDAAVNGAFAVLTGEEAQSRLDKARIANSRVNGVADLSEHPFLRNAQAVIGGTAVNMAALPVATVSGTAQDVPSLDQHGAAIRAEFS